MTAVRCTGGTHDTHFQFVFWLPDRPPAHAFPADTRQWPDSRRMDGVPGYSGGTAADSHRIPLTGSAMMPTG